MADTLSTTTSYKLLGGVNQKASKYEMSTAQFLDLRNVDFDVPNALQKRPGSTYAIGSGNGTTGPISSLFEFVKLTGESYMIAGSDTAMFYIAGTGLTLLSAGWNNGQPTDMLTFANKLWMANGQSWATWDGSNINPVGLRTSPIGYTIGSNRYTILNYFMAGGAGAASSYGLVGGATHLYGGVSWIARGVYVAYSYLRNDGYFGPVDFLLNARNIVRGTAQSNGAEFFAAGVTLSTYLDGFTSLGGGITAIALWVAVDTVSVGSSITPLPNGSQVQAGTMGYLEVAGAFPSLMSLTLLPSADLTRFTLFTLIPTNKLFAADPTAGSTLATWGTTFIFASYGLFDHAAGLGFSWSGMTSDFFATFTPKYQEISKNAMFASGFSTSPSVVSVSNIGEPEVFFPENSFEVRTDDGDRILGQKAFNNHVVIAKEHSFAKLIGDNPDNYELIELSADFGCLSNNTILTKEQTLFWLDKKGILEYTGANWKIVSDPVEGIFRRINVSAAKEKAVGVHHMYRNQLWWGIPIDGSSINNITVVYDYLIGAWTFFDGFNPASFVYAKSGLSKPTAWRGDYSGLVHYTGESFFADSGRGITCLGFTRYENVGGENQTTLWRRLFLDVATASGATGLIQGQVYTNYDNSTVQATFAMYQDQFQSRAEMGIMGKAVAAQFSHSSASLPLLINGYAWASRGLRNV